MKLITSTSAAVIFATLSLGAIAPAAFAQDQAPQAGPEGAPRLEHFRAHDHDGPGRDRIRGGMRGGLVQLVCAEQGAERLEHLFVSLSYRLDLTPEQAPLFDALKTSALTAQTSFSDTCASIRPAAGETAEVPNLVERLENRIKIDEARIAALSDVLPSLEAFYNGLTDEQQQKLDAPAQMRREHFGKRHGGGPEGDHGPGHRRMMLLEQNG
jgi:Spy/CpxP family protein refolding chaperone